MVRIIFLHLFFILSFSASLLVLSFFSTDAEAREEFEIEIGDKVRILSDRAFRKGREGKFEAVGNVIISQGKNAIYGEKASLNFQTGETLVAGNVRYIGPEVTMNGSLLEYNFKTKSIKLENSRLITEQFTLVGKRIERMENETVRAESAEYTTCRDCPESWSVFGKDVTITLGQYVSIKHAFIKMKGVVMLYLPYIIFPIKKKRESGLLFPKISFDFDEGVRFQQPFFLAINDSVDATFTPTVYGRRGLMNMVQYRQALGEKKWFEINSLQNFDRIYEPNKVDDTSSGESHFRHFSTYEHHWSSGFWFNHHLFVNQSSDIDTLRDYEFYNFERVRGDYLGVDSFFDFRFPLLQFSFDGGYRENVLVRESEIFDTDYVQVVPNFSFQAMPFQLFKSDLLFLNRGLIDLKGEFNRFRQDIKNEEDFVRNADRLHFEPSLDWNLGYLGPLNLQNQLTYETQMYRFPTIKNKQKDSFKKSLLKNTLSLGLDIEKVFGIAYEESIPIEETVGRSRDDNLDSLPREKIEERNRLKKINDAIVGSIPLQGEEFFNRKIRMRRFSYRHLQKFRINHFYLSDEKRRGNEDFYVQVNEDAGQFDFLDAPRELQFKVQDRKSSTSLPLKNTIELQWNHIITKKSPKEILPESDGRLLGDNFSYSNIAFLDFSQGFDLDESSSRFEDRLTRLKVSGGGSINKFSMSFNEYYFYQTNQHLFDVGVNQKFRYANLGLSFTYDGFSVPVVKYSSLNGELFISNNLAFEAIYDFNLEDKKATRTKLISHYRPPNNCWKLDLQYEKTQIETSLSFNFLIKYNEGQFTGAKQ